MKTILCYGDSNTYGYDPAVGRGSRYPYEKRWTSILAGMLGPDYCVVAEGLNGRTTAYDRPGFPWKNGLGPLAAIMGSHKPLDYIVFMLGTNDCNVEMGLSAGQIAYGMECLVNTAREMSMVQQERVPEIIVVAPAPIDGDISMSPFYGEIDASSVEKSVALAALYEDIAKRYGCRFVNATGCEVADDCEHLTELGHRQLAEMLFEEIK